MITLTKLIQTTHRALNAVVASRKLQIITAALLLVIVASSTWAVHSVSMHNKLIAQKQSDSIKKLQAEQAAELAKKHQMGASAGSSDSQTDATGNAATSAQVSTASPSASAKTPTKYSTSSDPRSTAYSTTPPAANPASFSIPITHAGQVAPGTLISYNATKGEKEYYGGDLILSPSAITIHRSSDATAPFTASMPDGQVGSFIAMPWDDQSPIGFIASNSTQGPGTSWSLFVALKAYPSLPPVGTYVIHMSTHRAAQAADGWQYDGFITVNVID